METFPFYVLKKTKKANKFQQFAFRTSDRRIYNASHASESRYEMISSVCCHESH